MYLSWLKSGSTVTFKKCMYCWGKPERAPHTRVERDPCLSVCIHHTLNTHFCKYSNPKDCMCHMNHKVLLNTESWCQSTPRSTPQTMQGKLRRRRTDTTHRPTYSMARAIQATTWQKGFICRCHCLTVLLLA